jgi:hypothetical protein
MDDHFRKYDYIMPPYMIDIAEARYNLPVEIAGTKDNYQ